VRYRNFRTFVGNESAQLTCLAVDPSGEVVCAGAIDPFEVYVWYVASQSRPRGFGAP
jgi:periodic tryptophan protein 2